MTIERAFMQEIYLYVPYGYQRLLFIKSDVLFKGLRSYPPIKPMHSEIQRLLVIKSDVLGIRPRWET